jgi:hypothetical protein
MDSKFLQLFYFSFFLFLFSSFGQGASDTVKLKGGMIYKHEGTAQINQDILQYKRYMDTNALFSVAQKLSDVTKLYNTYCDMVSQQQIATTKDPVPVDTSGDITFNGISRQYVSTTLKYPILDSLAVCTRLQAREVEIRNLDTLNAVRTYASEHNITRIKAGTKYIRQNGRFEFITDHYPVTHAKDIFPQVQYGGSYDTDNMAMWDDPFFRKLAPDYSLIYRDPISNFLIRLATKEEMNTLDFIMCEQDLHDRNTNTSEVKNMFTAIADHSCKRDTMAINAQTQYSLSEN